MLIGLGVREESHTVNLCQQCYNERLTAQGQAPLTSWQWKAVVEKKAHRGRLWRMLGKDMFSRNVGVFLSCKSESEKNWEMLRRKSRKGHKANNNKSLMPKNIWNK